MHLKDLTTAPPGSWQYTQPQSGYTMVGITFQQLVNRVAQHRQNMNYPTEGHLATEVECQICDRLAPVDQIAYCQTGLRPVTSVHWRRVAGFLATLAKWFVKGFALVPQEEAERRAAICAKCPLNVGLSGCGSCRMAIKEMRTQLMKASTSHDSVLMACGICGCDNATQVHVPIDALRTGKPLDYPKAWCWKAPGGVNESTI